MGKYTYDLPRPCNKCGKGKVVCEMVDQGATDYYLRFTHTCSDCGVVQADHTHTWSGCEDEGAFVCPMCHHNYAQSFTGGADLELTEVLSSGRYNPVYYIKLANQTDAEITLHQVDVQSARDKSMTCLESTGIRLLQGDFISICLPSGVDAPWFEATEIRWKTTAGSTWWNSRSFESIRKYIVEHRARMEQNESE